MTEPVKSDYCLVRFNIEDVVPTHLTILLPPAPFGHRGSVALVGTAREAEELKRKFPNATSSGFFTEEQAKTHCLEAAAREDQFLRFCATHKLNPAESTGEFLRNLLTQVPIWPLALDVPFHHTCEQLGMKNLYDLLSHTEGELMSKFGTDSLPRLNDRLLQIQQVLTIQH